MIFNIRLKHKRSARHLILLVVTFLVVLHVRLMSILFTARKLEKYTQVCYIVYIGTQQDVKVY